LCINKPPTSEKHTKKRSHREVTKRDSSQRNETTNISITVSQVDVFVSPSEPLNPIQRSLSDFKPATHTTEPITLSKNDIKTEKLLPSPRYSERKESGPKRRTSRREKEADRHKEKDNELTERRRNKLLNSEKQEPDKFRRDRHHNDISNKATCM